MFSTKSLIIIVLCFAAIIATACQVASAAGPETAPNPQPVFSSELTTLEEPIAPYNASELKGSLIASPDRHSVAYITEADGNLKVVNSGEQTPEANSYSSISELQFSPDSRQIAYIAMAGKETFLVISGNERKQDSAIQFLHFSPDSQRLAYEAEHADGTTNVVIDSYISSPYDHQLMFPASPSEGKLYDGIVPSSIQFSADSQQIAYVARVGHLWRMVIGEKEGNSYDAILNIGPLEKDSTGDSSYIIRYTALLGNQVYSVEDSIK